MNVLINAVTIVEGGGLVVLKNLLNAMSSVNPDIKWFVAAKSEVLIQFEENKNTIKIPANWVNRSPFHHLFWYEYMIPKLIKKFNINLLFSQTNFLPHRKLSCPTLLLVQHAGYFSDDFKKLFNLYFPGFLSQFLWKIKSHWINTSIKKASVITVQTHALERKIKSLINIPEQRISVIPHGIGLIQNKITKVRNIENQQTIRIGYITKFGVQKDFDTAFKAIKILKDKKINVKFILTLDKNSKEFIYVFRLIDKYNIHELIENHGELSQPTEINKLYNTLHIFIFPSLCESFGFTLIEAMACGLPLVVSNTESNLELVGDNAEIFNKGDATQLADKIIYLIKNNEQYQKYSQKSIDRAKMFSWEKAAQNTLHIFQQFNWNNI